MKTTNKLMLALFICLCLTNFAFATKWRINNNSVQASFTQLSQAFGSVSVMPGDTLYLEGSVFNYEDANLYKRLVIIGPGYFLGENDSTQANVNSAKINSISFQPGSRGSVMMGVTVISTCNVQDTGIVVKRNNLGTVSINNCSNTILIQNYIATRVSVNNAMNNIISNNLFPLMDGYTQNITVASNASALVTNNIFRGPQLYNNCILRNNIATGLNGNGNDAITLTNTTMEHNIAASSQYGSSNGNMDNIYMNSVFVNTGTSDGKFKLKAGSVAIGAGTGGTDSGIFGGDYPYILSGLPEVPAIWYMNVNGSSVTVKAKSH